MDRIKAFGRKPEGVYGRTLLSVNNAGACALFLSLAPSGREADNA